MNNVCKHLKEEKKKADMRIHDDYVDDYAAGSTSASPYLPFPGLSDDIVCDVSDLSSDNSLINSRCV